MCEGCFWDAGYQNYFYAQPGSGYLHTNCWSWIDGHWYGFEANSEMSRGWTLGAFNIWYYCAPYSGAQTNSGYWYPEGCMYWSDWAWIGGYCYYFWGNGAMAANCLVDGSWVDENGHWSSSTNGDSTQRQEMTNLINAERIKNGLSPIIFDEKINEAADYRAAESATPRYNDVGLILSKFGVRYSYYRYVANNPFYPFNTLTEAFDDLLSAGRDVILGNFNKYGLGIFVDPINNKINCVIILIN